MFAAAITRGDVLVRNVIPKHLESITSKILEIGCTVQEIDDAVSVIADEEHKVLMLRHFLYPGYQTDMQPQYVVALALAKGTSIVTESIFENRLMYVDELVRMGAGIKVEGNTAIIEGVEKMT
jgi:UDP-N-acetylglucosamine 1-carboxyvinyltransferase